VVFVGAAVFEAAAAYQVCTPLWPLQAPDLLGAVEYVPSLQIPVAPAGAPAGACAIPTCNARTPAESAIKRIISFIYFLRLAPKKIRANCGRIYHSTVKHVQSIPEILDEAAFLKSPIPLRLLHVNLMCAIENMKTW
jgi:hypothetical protein